MGIRMPITDIEYRKQFVNVCFCLHAFGRHQQLLYLILVDLTHGDGPEAYSFTQVILHRELEADVIHRKMTTLEAKLNALEARVRELEKPSVAPVSASVPPASIRITDPDGRPDVVWKATDPAWLSGLKTVFCTTSMLNGFMTFAETWPNTAGIQAAVVAKYAKNDTAGDRAQILLNALTTTHPIGVAQLHYILSHLGRNGAAIDYARYSDGSPYTAR